MLSHAPFHGHEILGIFDRRSNSWHIPFRPVCDGMCLDPDSQIKRLKRWSWATTVMMSVVASDGKTREMVTVDRRTFIMWLATLVTSRIPDLETRRLIEIYQAEAADVLERHFGLAPTSPPIPQQNQPSTSGLPSIAEIETKPLLAFGKLLVAGIERQDVLERTQREQGFVLENLEQRLITVEDDLVQLQNRNPSQQAGWQTLASFAHERGIAVKGTKAQREGRIVAAVTRSLGLEPGWCLEGPETGNRTYPIEALERWASGFLARQHKHPTLFAG